MNKSIAFICGDNRQIYLANLFNQNNYKTYTYDLSSEYLSKSCTKCTSLNMAINSAQYIVFPFRIDCISLMQLSAILPYLNNKTVFGGCIESELKHLFIQNNIKYYDYFKDNSVNKLNAIANAEGSIYYAINNSTINLHNSNVLVLGYGNCGSILSHKLKALGCNVTVTGRTSYSKACACSNMLNYIDLTNINSIINSIHQYDFIFNTVPSLILTDNLLSNVKTDCVIIDVASSPS